MLLKDKVAVVTGGAQGIGKAISERLAAEGAAIAVCDINEEIARITAQKLASSKGIKAAGYKVNVVNENEVLECVNKILDNFGRIDILINNAGVTRDGLLIRMKEEDWDLVLNVNLKGTFNFTKAVAKPMMKARSGRMVNVASIIGLIGNVGQSNYAASKAGIIGFSKSVARELAPRNINVNAVAPGFIDTQMTHVIPEDIKKKMLESIPFGRMGSPEEVADTVLFLTCDLSKYITGQVITIDGGMVM
ncbi:MAG: 3-oxoacyl-[acyl-carrier-protein] reductase [Candidatus Ancaeobacter aquaticus]|nr:3-oxoacyl-[acyl-carrier-protein] reductase [Candidatus Ancaeobacter aquaticus]